MRPSPKNLERWDIYSHELQRPTSRRIEQSKAMEYGSRKASPEVSIPHYIYICMYVCMYVCIRITLVSNFQRIVLNGGSMLRNTADTL